jgi:solute carrier family 44 (choline transporter-like protein), member 2/4/5
MQRYVADIGKSWPVFIVCGGILPLLLSVIWLLMIRYFVAAMPWITVFLFNALVISVTMFCYIKGMPHHSNPYVGYFVHKAWSCYFSDTLYISLIVTLCITHSAGWIGNDPLTVVIGVSDPYVHISGQVSISS